MKKQISNFESNALSRKEMKSLNGGYFGCKTGICTLVTIKGSNTTSHEGFCSVYYRTGTGDQGCFCNVGTGIIPLSSNNGISHCTEGS